MKRSNIYDLDHLISNRVKTSAFCIMEEQRKHDLIVFSSYSSHQFDLKKKKKLIFIHRHFRVCMFYVMVFLALLLIKVC
jgi:hypothetical protein